MYRVAQWWLLAMKAQMFCFLGSFQAVVNLNKKRRVKVSAFRNPALSQYWRGFLVIRGNIPRIHLLALGRYSNFLFVSCEF